jgi:hypothetical protein
MDDRWKDGWIDRYVDGNVKYRWMMDECWVNEHVF